MFNGKRERALEERLENVIEQNERRKELFWEIADQQDNVLEQFARLTASRAQMEKDVQQVEEHLVHITELTKSSGNTAGDLQSEMIAINNAVGTFEVNHGVFVRQRKEQDEKVMEIVENNKHFTTPMKYISELPAAMREESSELHERAARMLEFSKSMGVLSLNAAIEAGRMGEAGEKFITAVEEIRQYSENYEKETQELKEQLQKSDVRIEELEEQVHHLNELLKENNISMGKLLKDGMMSMATYEANQLELRSVVSENAVGRADAMLQSEDEKSKVEERMKLQLGDIRDEMEEQKNSIDELETIFKGMQLTAKRGQID